MGRELRKVPANWEHPKKENGNYQPMFNEFYGDAFNDWLEEHNQWLDGTHPDLKEEPELKDKYPFFAMWGGNPPDVEYYHKKKYLQEELTHIQLYETTSEGKPCSPVFKLEDFEKLCEYAAENCTTFASYKATKEEWMEMLDNGFVYHQRDNVMFM